MFNPFHPKIKKLGIGIARMRTATVEQFNKQLKN
jgi:hypothetical protein